MLLYHSKGIFFFFFGRANVQKLLVQRKRDGEKLSVGGHGLRSSRESFCTRVSGAAGGWAGPEPRGVGASPVHEAGRAGSGDDSEPLFQNVNEKVMSP